MATFRVGVGSFNIKTDGSVGIGTEGVGHGNLKVEGVIKSTNLDVLGVSTFTRYSGFHADNISVTNRDLTLSGEYSTTGDVVVEDGASLTVGLGSTSCVGSVECISVKHHFSVPVGDTAQRNETSGYAEGTVRYNTDLGTMEFFNGSEWRQFTYISDIQHSPSSRGRAVFAGGTFDARAPVSTSPRMDFINISTFGNSLYFGELVVQRRQTSCCGNSIRSQVWGGQGAPANLNEIDYFTIASEGNAIDFGNMLSQAQTTQGLSSSTRGISYGHGEPASNVIQYTQIATLGDAVDFGDCSEATRAGATWASPTRGMLAGGASKKNNIEYITIASLGNGTDFGELTESRRSGDGCSNSVRGLAMGGYDGANSPYPRYKTIDYVTIASTGNAIYFGDLSNFVSSNGCAASQTRGISAGGSMDSGSTNAIDFITIASTGDAKDFGDLSEPYWNQLGATSDCHGGLGGY